MSMGYIDRDRQLAAPLLRSKLRYEAGMIYSTLGGRCVDSEVVDTLSALHCSGPNCTLLQGENGIDGQDRALPKSSF